MKKLNELTIIEARDGLKAKKFSSVELVSACLDQIEKYDSKIKAFVTVLPREQVLNDAKKADNEIAKNGSKAFDDRPLLGIPYSCKDNFNTKGIETTASSNILRGYIPPYESTVTKRLKDAGAILLGKTNLDAFAHGSSTETSDFGPTYNPWDLKRVPGGSSGGSASAVVSNMCIFSIGSETAGSIRGPASWCGITGFKPTYGRVSRYGVIAMASSTDSPGPLTKTVLDTTLVLEVLAGKDPFDATSSNVQVDVYSKSVEKSDLSNVKIGKPKSYFNMDIESEVKEKVDLALKEFESLGAKIIDVDLIDPKYSIAVYTILQRSEVSSNLARFDGIRYGHKRNSFGTEAKKRMMLGAYSLSSGYYDDYYAKAQKVRTLLVKDFNSAFENVDLIVGPTMPSIAPKIGVSEDSALFGELTDALQEPSSIAGLCAVSISCGFSKGLPVGVQLMGPQFSESLILGVAHKYQQVTDFHKKFPKEDLWD